VLSWWIPESYKIETYKEYPEMKGISKMFNVEAMFVLVAAVLLYGWLKGLLIYSALSSLLRIVLCLQHLIRRR
jgi:hypothetical protein